MEKKKMQPKTKKTMIIASIVLLVLAIVGITSYQVYGMVKNNEARIQLQKEKSAIESLQKEALTFYDSEDKTFLKSGLNEILFVVFEKKVEYRKKVPDLYARSEKKFSAEIKENKKQGKKLGQTVADIRKKLDSQKLLNSMFLTTAIDGKTINPDPILANGNLGEIILNFDTQFLKDNPNDEWGNAMRGLFNELVRQVEYVNYLEMRIKELLDENGQLKSSAFSEEYQKLLSLLEAINSPDLYDQFLNGITIPSFEDTPSKTTESTSDSATIPSSNSTSHSQVQSAPTTSSTKENSQHSYSYGGSATAPDTQQTTASSRSSATEN